jgi:hypothetical protein
MRWAMMGIVEACVGIMVFDAMKMVGVTVILATYYPCRLVVRDGGEGGFSVEILSGRRWLILDSWTS